MNSYDVDYVTDTFINYTELLNQYSHQVVVWGDEISELEVLHLLQS